MFGSLNVRFQPEQAYYIKAGYHHAHTVEVFDDKLNKDEWQRSVYESGRTLLNEMKGKSVIDLGCGSAFKLIEMFGNFTTTGIELTDTYHWLLKKYPSRNWLAFEHAIPSLLKTDLVICSDAIEHVKNPDEIMDFIKSMDFKWLLISTPERDSIRGKKDFGPPENTSHYREWNKEEFKEYVSTWFTIKEQIISRDKSVSQVLICTRQISRGA